MDWIPAVSSTSVLAILIFLSRHLIVARLTNAVKHEYDSKLEQLKAELSKREKEIESLRQVGLNGLQQRQASIFNKQIEAVELLWAATCKLHLGKPVSEMMLRVKTEEVSKSISYDANLQKFFKYISMHADMKKMTEIDPNPARPFVSKLAWAYYSAYSSIIWHYVLQANLFENGLGDNLLETKKLTKLVSVALPHQVEYIEKFGVSVFGHLLEELQNKILEEVDSMISGKYLDTSGLQKAAKIQELAQELSDKNKDLTG
ncbi:hypothetical protein A9Q75_01560 [Colwellia psychrerythraea]|uniref:Uncharacterized protein n=1 Tax=Colwellia psychrerythraea TaxID=28229 RepID=A0A1Y5EVZ6_COLPS|nr:hypothetical protein A9Q75_01560 [Colwellia psychrerythraea]